MWMSISEHPKVANKLHLSRTAVLDDCQEFTFLKF
jgi:hypothetical protein